MENQIKDINDTIVESVLRSFDEKNQKFIHVIRMIIIGLLSLLITLAHFAVKDKVNIRLDLIAPILYGYFIILVVLWFVAFKIKYRPRFVYVLITMDLMFVLFLLMVRIFSSTSGIVNATSLPLFFSMFLLNALSGLRFNMKTSLYCAFLSIIVVTVLGGIEINNGFYPGIGAGMLHLLPTTVFLTGTALVSGYIGYRSKQIISKVVIEQEEKKMYRRIFGHFASENVLDDAMKHGLKLGGEEKNVTILFSDIRGFTGLSERNEASDIVSILNTYFSNMADSVMKNGGTINKFIGDGMLVLFGAPISRSDDAVRAVSTALDMLDNLAEVNRKIKKEFNTDLTIGIGINTGNAIVGNIGSLDRMEYTVIGDAVNIAARIEGLNKKFATSILISGETHSLVKNFFITRRISRVKVKGREKNVDLYEVLSKKKDKPE